MSDAAEDDACSTAGLAPPVAADISLNAWIKPVYMFLGHTLLSMF